MKLDIRWIRDEFPICRQKFPIPGEAAPQPIRYFDHGASTHPPRAVLDAHREFLEKYYANIHRGHHNLSMIASDLFDRVSETVARYVGADLHKQTIYLTTNTTSALDLAAYAMSHEDGVVLTSVLEHHSNDLPFRARGETVMVGMCEDGTLDMADLKKKLADHKVKLVTVTAASNVTGWMPKIHEIARLAHAAGARICVDGAQMLAHHPVDLKPNDPAECIDFFAAAGHKAYAPFGSAFLVAPTSFMDALPPYRPGGGAVLAVTEDDVVWTTGPDRHLGGTPNIPGAIAMAKALDFLSDIGLDAIRHHEVELTRRAIEGLQAMDGIELYGPPDAESRLGVVSFNIEGVHHDLASAILNNEGAIATRNGCFCAHPYLHLLLRVGDVSDLVDRLRSGDENAELPGALRVSMGVFNTEGEVDFMLGWIQRIRDRKWSGTYDLEKRDYCKEVYFEFQGIRDVSGPAGHPTARV
ncbi:MAG: class V aminotransferase [Gemmatimonadota bacterium]|nr:MAG: class V aminotransferase [Gemmatimonadota bacterium]